MSAPGPSPRLISRKIPSALGTAFGSAGGAGAGAFDLVGDRGGDLVPAPLADPSPTLGLLAALSSATTNATLNVASKSLVTTSGAPMITSSACLHAITPNDRSFTFKIG
eukprot:31176-Pelagococcus_subviridis.AAC.19